MSMESFSTIQGAEIFAGLGFLVTGVSHIVNPREWAEFFIALRGKGRTGVFINGFIHFNFGAIIASFHNVWSWPHVALTVIGWLLVAKGAISFVAPGLAMLSLNRVSLDRAWEFRVAGVFSVLLGAGCFYLWLYH